MDDFKKEKLHAPVKQEKECLNCHLPHAAFTKALLNAPKDQFCFKCHKKDELFKGKIHPPAEDDCGTCHAPHQSGNDALLIQEDSMALCKTCHDKTDSTHFHPMGGEVKDPRTGKMLVCISCHNPHASPYDPLLIEEKTRKLCVQCHKG
jgi:predicted CXXCH cytochrome family protein